MGLFPVPRLIQMTSGCQHKLTSEKVRRLPSETMSAVERQVSWMTTTRESWRQMKARLWWVRFGIRCHPVVAQQQRETARRAPDHHHGEKERFRGHRLFLTLGVLPALYHVRLLSHVSGLHNPDRK